jgi:hypothetical protein
MPITIRPTGIKTIIIMDTKPIVVKQFRVTIEALAKAKAMGLH